MLGLLVGIGVVWVGCSGGSGGGTSGPGGATSSVASTTSTSASGGSGGSTTGTGGASTSSSTSTTGTGTGTGGGVPPGTWARDMGLPWTDGPCQQWTRNPPEIAYRPPLVTSEGVWAAAGDSYLGTSLLMRKGPSGWRMDASPIDFPAQLHDLLGDDTTLFAVLEFGDVYARSGGHWATIGWPSTVTNPKTLFVSAAGSTLFMAGDQVPTPGNVAAYDGTWHTLPTGTWTTTRGVWGTSATDVYAAHSKGLQHYDGTAWTELAPSFPTLDVIAVGGSSSSTVYAATATTMYQVSGGSMTPASNVPQSGCTVFSGILGSPGHVLVRATCGGSSGIWQSTGSTWAALPALPAGADASLLRVQSDGTISLGGPTMYTLTGGAWVAYPIETPAPVTNALGTFTGARTYAFGDTGIVRLMGSTWSPVAGAPAPTFIHAIWAAPDDGTLFLAVPTAPNSPSWNIHRYDGSAWHLDMTVNVDVTGPLGLEGATSSRVLFLTSTAIYQWNGTSWGTIPQPPMPAGNHVISVAYAGSSHILAAYQANQNQPQNLVEYDGSAWTNLGTVSGGCCGELGPSSSPDAYVYVSPGVFQILGDGSFSMLSTTPPPATSMGGFLDVVGGSPTSLLGYEFDPNSKPYYAVGTNPGSGPWTFTRSWTLRGTQGSNGPNGMSTDGHAIIGATSLGGIDPSGPLPPSGGDAITRCTVVP